MLKFYSKGDIMGMNKKQYNKVINWTLKQEQSTQANNSLELAKAIFNNMGVALPNGTLPEVCEVLAPPLESAKKES